MATASPIGSQLQSSQLTSSSTRLIPRGISGSPLRNLNSKRRPILTPTFQVVQPINGNRLEPGNPGESSLLIAWYISNLPAYDTAVNPLLRDVEVGLAHGILLVGPFVKASPLRNITYAGATSSLAATGLVVIFSICLTMYGIPSFKEGEPSTAPSLTLTGRKKEADKLKTADRWAQFSGGFFLGGILRLFGPTSCSMGLTFPTSSSKNLNL